MVEYIDRQAVLDELDEDIEEFVECDYALKTAKKYIKKIPPADVRPVVRGRWILDNRPDGGLWACSNCKFPSEAFAVDRLYKFCPNCGADMRERGADGDEE